MCSEPRLVSVFLPASLFEIASHQDWLPTFLAAVGVPDISQRLLEGRAVGDRTYYISATTGTSRRLGWATGKLF
jgi:hypothetical protein